MIRRFYLLLLALPVAAHAQALSFGVFPVDPVTLIRHLLGTNAAFTATAEISGEGPNDADNFHVDTSYAMLGEELHTQTDLAKLRGLNACDVAQGHLQEMGLDDTVMIVWPSAKVSYIVYPRARAYIETPLTWRERLKDISSVQKERLGTETVDGRRCVKYRLQVTNATGDENEVLVWEATDLQNFPVQLYFAIDRSAFRILFHDVKLERPDVAKFQPPAEYDRYTTLRELVHVRHGYSEPRE